MNPRELRARLIARSVSGRYDLFLGVGAGLALLGAALLLVRLSPADMNRIDAIAPLGVAAGPRYPEGGMKTVNG